jgi:hypothetical protein
MSLDPITALLDIGGKVIDKIFPDPEKRDAAKLELFKLQQSGELAVLAAETDLAKAQIETNNIEAQSDSLFKSGWRPATGWVCVSGLSYQIVFRPLFGWLGENVYGWTIPPALELDTLLTLLFGLLGLGAYRTAEKIRLKG